MSIPPPLPSPTRKKKLVFVAALVLTAPIALCLLAISVLRMLGLIHPFLVPTGAMSPTIAPGDHIVMEKLTYLRAKPKRGDIIVFKTDGIPALIPDTLYVKRLIGLPGDELSLRNGHIFINGKQTSFENKNGEIEYVHFSQGVYLSSDGDAVVVPANKYFVLGDNSRNSADSRFWGFLPEQSVVGRCVACDWPPSHIGLLR